MKFEMEKLIDNELTNWMDQWTELGTQLAEFICKNYERIPNEPACKGSHIKRITIPVLADEDDELGDSEFAFIEEVMKENHCLDIWILWTEDWDGELEEWWISGDNR